jgi:hypothetical protein
MTPTLWGRWQTRLFLLATVGVIISLPFVFGLIGHEPGYVYFWILGYVFLFGLAWDLFYDFLQKFMWDHDWPGAFQLIAAIAEGIFLALVIKIVHLPHVPTSLDLRLFAFHYSVVWVAIYLASWSVMRVLFPRWRFRGGQWLGRWSQG